MTIERRRRSRVDASRVRINWIGELACRNSSSVTCARSVNGRCDPRDRSEGSLSYRKRIGEPWLVRIGPIPRPRCRAREKKSESHRPRRSTAIDAGSVCGFCERERECACVCCNASTPFWWSRSRGCQIEAPASRAITTCIRHTQDYAERDLQFSMKQQSSRSSVSFSTGRYHCHCLSPPLRPHPSVIVLKTNHLGVD